MRGRGDYVFIQRLPGESQHAGRRVPLAAYRARTEAGHAQRNRGCKAAAEPIPRLPRSTFGAELDRICRHLSATRTMTISEMTRLVLQSLDAQGLEVTDGRARRQTSEILWIVEPDPVPCGHRLGIDVGSSIRSHAAGRAPMRANDCHIYIALENLPLAAEPTESLRRFNDYLSLAIAALDLRTQVSDEERTTALERVIQPLAHVIATTGTIDDIRSRFAEGLFDSAFVDRAARALLGNDR